MKFELDFAHPRPRPAPLGWALLALGLVAAGWAGWRYQDVAATAQAEQARLDALVPRATRKAAGKPLDKAASGLAASRQLLAADWGGLLVELETARPEKRIALLNLEAEAGRNSLGITAEAVDHTAMLDWVDALEALPSLEKVTLASHANQDRDGEKSVRFTLRARWLNPGGSP